MSERSSCKAATCDAGVSLVLVAAKEDTFRDADAEVTPPSVVYVLHTSTIASRCTTQKDPASVISRAWDMHLFFEKHWLSQHSPGAF